MKKLRSLMIYDGLETEEYHSVSLKELPLITYQEKGLCFPMSFLNDISYNNNNDKDFRQISYSLKESWGEMECNPIQYNLRSRKEN